MYLKWLVFLNKLDGWFTETVRHIEAFVKNRDVLIRNYFNSKYELHFNRTRDKLKKHPLPEDPEAVLYLRLYKKAMQVSSTLGRIEEPDPEYSATCFSMFIATILCTAFAYFMVVDSKLAAMPISLVFIVVIAVLISYGGEWLKHKIAIKHLATLNAAIEFLRKRDQRPELDLAEIHKKSSCYDVTADSIGEVPRM